MGLRRDGKEFPMTFSICQFACDSHSYLAFIFRDVSEQKARETRLAHEANHDSLTGLANRRLLLDQLKKGMSHADRYGSKTALLFLDLDGFKPVNDEFGHEAGDKCLCEVADRLRDCVRFSDTVARIGGDEFGILLDEVASQNQAWEVATKIRKNLERPIDIGKNHIKISTSVGIVHYPNASIKSDVNALIRQADNAMYKEKNARTQQCVGMRF